jgi:hypothetical protein
MDLERPVIIIEHSREYAEKSEAKVNFISKDDLLVNKRASGRPRKPLLITVFRNRIFKPGIFIDER